MVSHYREVYARDRQWIMGFDVGTLEKFAWPLFIGFLCLNFLDVYTTTLAFNFGPLFHEENPLAAALFNLQFQGYLLALLFKYLPTIPLFYIVFVKDGSRKHELQIRMLKLAGVIALVGADLLLLYIVGINNIGAFMSVV
jgi:Domain of unknown function (DUF5658)